MEERLNSGLAEFLGSVFPLFVEPVPTLGQAKDQYTKNESYLQHRIDLRKLRIHRPDDEGHEQGRKFKRHDQKSQGRYEENNPHKKLNQEHEAPPLTPPYYIPIPNKSQLPSPDVDNPSIVCYNKHCE